MSSSSAPAIRGLHRREPGRDRGRKAVAWRLADEIAARARWQDMIAERPGAAPARDELLLLASRARDWLAAQIVICLKRPLKRLDVTSWSLIALTGPGSCFAGSPPEPAPAGQHRNLGETAPSLHGLRNLFQVNVEEGRLHVGAGAPRCGPGRGRCRRGGAARGSWPSPPASPPRAWRAAAQAPELRGGPGA
jgi:hypothetical protein